jgi:hypothetical protein
MIAASLKECQGEHYQDDRDSPVGWDFDVLRPGNCRRCVTRGAEQFYEDNFEHVE